MLREERICAGPLRGVAAAAPSAPAAQKGVPWISGDRQLQPVPRRCVDDIGLVVLTRQDFDADPQPVQPLPVERERALGHAADAAQWLAAPRGARQQRPFAKVLVVDEYLDPRPRPPTPRNRVRTAPTHPPPPNPPLDHFDPHLFSLTEVVPEPSPGPFSSATAERLSDAEMVRLIDSPPEEDA